MSIPLAVDSEFSAMRKYFFESHEAARTDMIGYRRYIGRNVYASKCGKCGRYARLVSGNMGADTAPAPWEVTHCNQCGEVTVEHRWDPKKGWKSFVIPTPARVREAPPREFLHEFLTLMSGHACACGVVNLRSQVEWAEHAKAER